MKHPPAMECRDCGEMWKPVFFDGATKECVECESTNVRPLTSKPVDEDLDKVLAAVDAEVTEAIKAWPTWNSAHEGFAILAEEIDELWDHVKMNQKKRDISAMRKEAIQVAAMAVRFAVEICNEERGRK